MVYKIECYMECNPGTTKFFVSTDEKGAAVKTKVYKLFGAGNILSVRYVADPAKTIAKFNTVFA